MSDPRNVPGWTQQRAPLDESERYLLKKMQGDGYVLMEGGIEEMYARNGGQEHIEMIESLERLGYCNEEGRDGGIAWTLTDQGMEEIGLPPKVQPEYKPCLHTDGCSRVKNCSCENCKSYYPESI